MRQKHRETESRTRSGGGRRGGGTRMHAQVLIITLALIFGSSGGGSKSFSQCVEENMPEGPRRAQAVETAQAIEASVDEARRLDSAYLGVILERIEDYDSTPLELRGALDDLRQDWLYHYGLLMALRGQLRTELDREEWKAVFEDLEEAWFDR